MDRPFPAYKGDKPYIFVSYSHKDSEVVFPSIQWLWDQGFNIWYDEGISPGASWHDELAESILGCDLFILLVSPRSADSDICLKEVNYALAQNRPLLAIHVEATQLPPGLSLALSDRQAIFRHELTEDQYQEKVLSGVQSYIQQGQSVDTISTSLVTNTTSRPIIIGAVLISLAILSVGIFFYFKPGEEVVTSTPAAVADEPRAPGTATHETVEQKQSIAVLPFVNMSNDPEQEYFSDGLSEDILNGLANKPGIIVKARTSSFSFKGKNVDIRKIGEQLNATHILEGSVRKIGNRVRVTAQLIDTRGDAHIWSGQYDRDLVDVFAVQDEITSAILGALNVHFLPVAGVTPAPTTNMEAYNALLIGRYHGRRKELGPAIAAYEQAVALDSEYADAHALLAIAHSHPIWWYRASLQEKLPIISAHLNKALALNPEHPVALTQLAINRFFVDHDYQAAINELHKLIERNPNQISPVSIYYMVMRTLGKTDLMVQLGRRRVFLDPLSPSGNEALADALYLTGDFDAAESSYRQVERLGLGSPGGLYNVALIQGNLEEAQNQLDRDPSAWGHRRDRQLLFKAGFARRKGDSQRYKELLAEIKQTPVYQQPFGRYAVTLFEGEIDSALDQLEDMINESYYSSIVALRLPGPGSRQAYPGFYTHPRFYDIVKQVGLDDEAVAKLVIPPLPF